jgi:hypothetical protein
MCPPPVLPDDRIDFRTEPLCLTEEDGGVERRVAHAVELSG